MEKIKLPNIIGKKWSAEFLKKLKKYNIRIWDPLNPNFVGTCECDNSRVNVFLDENHIVTDMNVG